MRLLVEWVDSLNEWFGKAVSWLFLALVGSVSVDLLMRYFIGQGTDWAFDINYMIYGTQFMLAGAYTMKYNAHVRVDVIYNKFSPRGRAVLEAIFLLVIFFPLCGFLLFSCWSDFVQAVGAREISIVSAWHPPVYHYKAVMPLAFVLLILQGVAIFIRSLYTVAKRSEK